MSQEKVRTGLDGDTDSNGRFEFSTTPPPPFRLLMAGAGYWGKKLIESFAKLDDCRIVAVADFDPKTLAPFTSLSPRIKTFSTIEQALPSCDAVVIATPASTHFEIASTALRQGKHVFVEKPITTSVLQADELLEISQSNGLVLFPGHIYAHHPVVNRLCEETKQERFGRILQIRSLRANYGPVRPDVGALWDLAVHDVVIFQQLLGALPASVSCVASHLLDQKVHDCVNATLSYPDGAKACLYASWLEPAKRRELVVTGENMMASYDEVSDPNRMFLQPHDRKKFTVAELDPRQEITVERNEPPLEAECRAFLHCILNKESVSKKTKATRDITRILSALESSAAKNGMFIEL